MAKKIFALVASVVLVVCFAVTVSAASVSTTTTYVAGETAMADVKVIVSNVTAGDNVTYYATAGGNEVFVDQQKVADTATSVEFNYTTAHANIASAAYVVGSTDVTDAEEGTVPDADKYAITYGGATVGSVYPGEGATVTFSYTPAAYTTVTGVNANGVALDVWNFENNVITATVANVTGNVELTVVTGVKDIPGYTAELEIAEAAAIVVTASEEGDIKIDAVKDDLGEFTEDSTDTEKIAKANADAAGDRKLTVCGKAGDFAEYGIIVSTTAITPGSYRPADFAGLGVAYKAMDKAPNNMFAVQLIDTSDAGSSDSFVVEGTSYYVAVYGYVATEGDDAYHVKAIETPVVAE